MLWRVSNIVLPKSFRSAVIHCSMNNINTSNSDEISLDPSPIVIQISKLLFVDYYQETCIGSVTFILSRDLPERLLRHIYQNNFHEPTPIPDFATKLFNLNMQLYYKDHLHLIKNENTKFCKSIIETLHDV